MIYVLFGMSLLFVAVGFTVTENNAQYLLAGYNTMSPEERKRFDLKSFIPYFRKFHLFLGISFFVIGLALHYFGGAQAGGIFLGLYPIAAYIYFIWKTNTFSKGLNTKTNQAALYVMAATLVFVFGLLALGFKEDKLLVEAGKISIPGSYGEELTATDIASATLTADIPQITLKTNGFALGGINKGYFRTREGEIVKLLLHSDDKPFILITTKSGKRIYYSARTQSNRAVLKEIKKAMPHLVDK